MNYLNSNLPYWKQSDFWLVCAGAFLYFFSANIYLAELPNYLISLGGRNYLGLVIGGFTITAALTRPVAGWLTDSVGGRLVILIGMLVNFVAGLGYLLFPMLTGFLAVRFFHGFSAGFTPTGNSIYVAKLAGVKNRGVALGVSGFFGSLGFAIAPYLGTYLHKLFTIEYLFLISAVLGLVSVFITMKMRVLTKFTFSDSLKKLSFVDMFEWSSWISSVNMFLLMFSFGIVLTIMPLFSDLNKFDNRAMFLMIYVTTSLLVRPIAGLLSDKFGRYPVLIAANLCIGISMLGIPYSQKESFFWLMAMFYGLGAGLNGPVAFALAADDASPERVGRSISTVYLFLELGVGVGAFVSGIIYKDTLESAFTNFYLAGVLVMLSAVFLTLRAFIVRPRGRIL